jgi:4-hydroxybenzoate polyprenyltransferase
VVWLGLPLSGLVTSPEPLRWKPALVLLGSSALLILHTLLLNDWAGLTRSGPERQRLGLSPNQPLDARALVWASKLFGALGLGLFAWHELRLGGLAALWVAVSVLYSAPRTDLKTSTVGSPVVHFVGGTSLFLLGALASGASLYSSWPLSSFFGLVLVAGDFSHQVDHVEVDRASGFLTAAVRYGRDKAARAAFLLFLTAHAVLVGLWLNGQAPTALTVIFSLPAAIQLACAPIIWRPDAKPSTWRTYRMAYRSAFALALIGMSYFKLFEGVDVGLR